MRVIFHLREKREEREGLNSNKKKVLLEFNIVLLVEVYGLLARINV